MANQSDYIEDDGEHGKYFHVMLNMADDDLNPYQYRLLGHYKRVCGKKGACWESTRTTAKKTRMSVGMVSKTRLELETLGYINVYERQNETLRITLIDRMAENVARYADRSPDEQGVHGVNKVFIPRTRRSQDEQGVHGVKQRITNEEEPLQEEPLEESVVTAPTQPTTPSEKDTVPSLFKSPKQYDAFMLQNMGIPALFKAYADACPANAKPVVSNADKLKAFEAEDAGYTAEDVTALTKRKFEDEKKKKYPFAWMVSDLPAYRLEQQKLETSFTAAETETIHVDTSDAVVPVGFGE